MYLPAIVNGKLTTSLAVDEASHHNPFQTEFIAKKQKDNYILSGKKTFVIDGASSDLIIVLARTSGSRGDSTGLTLFVVNADQDGINKIKLDMADSRNYANITFDNVTVSSDAILGDLETAGETIDDILDIGRIAISAEMLGNAEAVSYTHLTLPTN